MKSTLLLLILFFYINYLSAQSDSIFVNIDGVKIQIWNTGVNANCASKFNLETVISNDTVYVFEIDTTDALERCTCNFDLCTEITGLPSGTYQVVIYRQLLLLYPDTLLYIGSISFIYGGSSITFSSNSYQSGCYHISAITGNEEQPIEFNLAQNYPNPFNPATKIKYSIQSATFRQVQVDNHVTLKVYDILGNEMAIIVDEYKPAGNYEVEFNMGSGNRYAASGVYFYQLGTHEFVSTKKMIFLK